MHLNLERLNWALYKEPSRENQNRREIKTEPTEVNQCLDFDWESVDFYSFVCRVNSTQVLMANKVMQCVFRKYPTSFWTYLKKGERLRVWCVEVSCPLEEKGAREMAYILHTFRLRRAAATAAFSRPEAGKIRVRSKTPHFITVVPIKFQKWGNGRVDIPTPKLIALRRASPRPKQDLCRVSRYSVTFIMGAISDTMLFPRCESCFKV